MRDSCLSSRRLLSAAKVFLDAAAQPTRRLAALALGLALLQGCILNDIRPIGAGSEVTSSDLPDVARFEGDRVYSLLAPDRIPAIDQPTMVEATAADFMADDELVLGVLLDGEAHAYSLWHLDRHEIVNDVVAGQPIAATWCPLAHTGVVFSRPMSEDGEATTLGVSGKLWREALVMYDRHTLSLWSQVDGVAKAGPLAGESLRKIPSQITTWAAWRARHPATRVLLKPRLDGSAYADYHESDGWLGVPWTRAPDDDRLPTKTLVLGVEVPTDAGVLGLAIRPESLEAAVTQGEIAGIPIVVATSGDPRAALAYRRTVQGRVLEFEWHPATEADRHDHLVDAQTGSRWNWLTGAAEAGPLADEHLEPLVTTPIYWGTWIGFHPGVELW